MYIRLLTLYIAIFSFAHKPQPDDSRTDAALQQQLRQAVTLFSRHPAAGIARAKIVYEHAQKSGNIIFEVRTLNTLAEFFWQIKKYNDAGYFINKSISAAAQHNIDSLSGYANVFAGVIAYDKGDFPKAADYYQQSIPYYKKAGLAKGLGVAYLNVGICKKKMALFKEANVFYFKAAEIFTQLHDDDNLSSIYNSIGNSYTSLHNYDKAVLYHKYALNIQKRNRDRSGIAQSLNNLGYTFKKAGQADSAIFYLNKCLQARSGLADSSVLVLTLQNLGSALQMKGYPDLAKKNIRRSLVIAAKYKMTDELARGNLDMAALYKAENNFTGALQALQITQATALEMHTAELLLDVYTEKAVIYARAGNYKQALTYQIKKEQIKDSLFKAAENKAIAELEIKYQTRQKEDRILLLNSANIIQKKMVKQQSWLIFVLVITAVLLLILLGVAYRSYRQKNQANRRIQILMQDLHHRVKNNLQILSGLFTMQIEYLSDEDTKATLRENETRLASMNLIHNKLYYNQTDTQIEMRDYLGKLLHHIKDSFGGERERKISLRIEVEPVKIEADKAVAIGLIVNELATNAFKYAFDDKPGEIVLSLQLINPKLLLLSMRDNGKGIEESSTTKKASFGLKLVHLMARQLSSSLIVKNDNGAFYRMEITI